QRGVVLEFIAVLVGKLRSLGRRAACEVSAHADGWRITHRRLRIGRTRVLEARFVDGGGIDHPSPCQLRGLRSGLTIDTLGVEMESADAGVIRRDTGPRIARLQGKLRSKLIIQARADGQPSVGCG